MRKGSNLGPYAAKSISVVTARDVPPNKHQKRWDGVIEKVYSLPKRQGLQIVSGTGGSNGHNQASTLAGNICGRARDIGKPVTTCVRIVEAGRDSNGKKKYLNAVFVFKRTDKLKRLIGHKPL